jgi:hypothetical protein
MDDAVSIHRLVLEINRVITMLAAEKNARLRRDFEESPLKILLVISENRAQGRPHSNED